MLRFVLRKMISKKWLFIALLIGNILLTGIACSNPIYAGAVMQRMLSDELDKYLADKNAYPGVISTVFAGSVRRNAMRQEYEEKAGRLSEEFGVPSVDNITHYYLNLTSNVPTVERDDAKTSSIMLGTITDFENHASITAGRMYSNEIRPDGVVEVVVSQRALIDLNLLLGERRVFEKLPDLNGNPLTIEVVGVFDVSDRSDVYWVRTPSSYRTECIMDYDIFTSLFAYDGCVIPLNATWYTLLDISQMRSDEAAHMYKKAQEYRALDKDDSYISMTINFDGILKTHLDIKAKVTVTLWVLQVPIYILLAAFIFMVSRQILETEESEIAVLKSRGVHRGKIMSMYALQSVLLALVAIAAGVPLGSFITQVLGSANAFLQFVSRRPLPAEIDMEALIYAFVAAAIAVCAMVLPVRKYSKDSIVTQKQGKHRPRRPLWRVAFLDVIALGVSVYGLYTFNAQKELFAQSILDGAVPDPLLFLCSSLFIIGAGLLAIRIIPLIVSLVFNVFKRLWSPAMYASFLKVLRQRANQDFIMIFLVMTIALGVFDAQTASTINESAEENTRYITGADIALREVWQNNSMQVEQNPSLDLIYYEPDFGTYLTMDGVESAAKVYKTSAISLSVSGGSVKGVNLMAIDTDDFGNTAWFDETLLPHHWYEYLNAMARNARAVLLSTNFKDEYGFKIGDAVLYQNAENKSARGIVYGFIDYWPGYAPVSYRRGTDNVYRETENFLIVANLSQVQDALGLLPYEVWLKCKDGSGFIYDYAEETGKLFTTFYDVEQQIVEKKNDPMLKSLNGVLTVGFIVVLALCVIGFLMYWILSIRKRTLQFGIFRAMGMSMREIFGMLINEQICISITAITVGAVVGFTAAKLFMPLIQIAYSSSETYLPLRLGVNLHDTALMFLLVGGMLLLCMIILVVIIRRMKIAQALKLGED